jgi:diguanylate cyclase (GGDEF)-like protein
MGEVDAVAEPRRDVAPLIASSVVDYVRHAVGPEAASTVAAVVHDGSLVDDLSDPPRWYSLDEILAMARVAAAITGETQMGRRIGEEIFRTVLSTGDAEFIAAVGSVDAGVEVVHLVGSKSSAGRLLSTVATGDDHLVFVAPFTNGVLPPDPSAEHRLFCDMLAGFYSQVPTLFGCLGTVVETSCHLHGAERCEFRLAWRLDPSVTSRDGDDAERSAGRSASVVERFEELQSMASDMVAVDDVDGVLERIIGHVSRALSAPQYLLVADPGDARQRVHAIGLTAGAAEELAQGLVDGELDDLPGLVSVPVGSGGQQLGVLAALFPPGTHASAVDQRLLAAYASHAAAAINVICSLQAARRDRDTAEALLSLARSLAEVASSREIAARICEAIPLVVACDEASVCLYDAETGQLSLVASTAPGGEPGSPRAPVFSPDALPGIPGLGASPHPVISRASTAPPALRASLEAFGLARVAAAPIHSRGEFLGLVTAGFAEEAGVGDSAEQDVLHRLAGLADHAATALENGRLLDRMREQATHDAITGLPNRVLVEDRGRQAFARRAVPGAGVGLLFIDLDRFKNVNDTLGHHAGDQLIRAVGQRLQTAMRDGDTLARLGGDEFVVLLPEVDGPDGCVRLANRLIDLLRAPFEIAGQELFISCSIGIAASPEHGSSYESLLQYADSAMYTAKGHGGSTVAVDIAAVATPRRQQLRLESQLHRSLDNGELRVHYQPQIELFTGRIVGAEALVRWEHPTEGLLLPGAFLPLAEETGLVIAIDEWVRLEAFTCARAWRDAGHELRVSVNVGARTLANSDLPGLIKAELAATGIEPSAIELEINENVVMHDVDELPAALAPLREIGVRIAIDDFGTGSSVLRRLQHCRIDTLKIDRSFLSGVTPDSIEVPLIKALLAMAHSLELTVVAEGVETAAQADLLSRYGCDLAQGWLYGHAVPADELLALLDAQRAGMARIARG